MKRVLNAGACLTVLLCAALVCVGHNEANAQPSLPTPAGSKVLKQLDGLTAPSGQNIGVVVYTTQQPAISPDRLPKTLVFAEVLVGAKGKTPRSVVARQKLPSAFAQEYRYIADLIDLRDGHWFVRFEAKPNTKHVSDKDTYLMLVAGGTGRSLPIIWAGRQDAIDPRARFEVSNADEDAGLELLQIDNERAVASCGKSWRKLFPKIWNFDQKRFIATASVASLKRQAPLLTATKADSVPTASRFPSMAKFHASSSDRRNVEAKPGERLSRPTDLSDGKLDTAWIEGVPGGGRGEFVTAKINAAFPMHGVRIVPGMTANEAQYRHHDSPRMVLLSFEDGTLLRVAFPRADLSEVRASRGFYIPFPEPEQTNCLTVTLLETHPAEQRLRRKTKGNSDDGLHTALSEITLLNTLDIVPRKQAIDTLVEHLLQESSTRRHRALITLSKELGSDMAPAIIEAQNKELAKPIAEAHPERLIPLLGLLKTDDALIFIKNLLDYSGLKISHLAMLQRNISFEGRKYVEPLFALALDPNMSERVSDNAARIISRAGPSNRMVELIPLLGSKRDNLRKSVVRGLARAGISASGALLDTATDPNTTPLAAHDALWALERIVRAKFRGEPTALPRGESIIQSYKNHDDLSLHLRALRLLRTVEVPNGDTFLISVLQGGERPEVRSLAAEALALYTNDKATDALLKALEDESPTVRIHAIKALQDRPNLPRVAKAVTAYAAREEWDRGLELAYRLLAKTSNRAGVDLLYDVVASDDARRASLVLKALNKTQSGIRHLALQPVIFDEARPDKLRKGAIRALAWSNDAASEKLLLDITSGAEKLPVDLRNTATRTLGNRRSPQVLALLLEVAKNNEPPELQRSAIRVLAYFSAKEVLPALRALRGNVDPRTARTLNNTISTLESRQNINDMHKSLH